MLKAAPNSFVFDNFSMGQDWTTPSFRLRPGYVADAKNVNLNQFMAMDKRKGCSKLYSTAFVTSTPIKSLYEYIAPNGTSYLLVTAGPNIGYHNGTSWVDLRSNLTDGLRHKFVTQNGFCYIVNGTDNNYKLYNEIVYDNVGIAPPLAAPTVAVGALTGLTGTYKYVYAYKRSYPLEFIGNYSAASASTGLLTNQSVAVTYVGSLDPQVDTIVIYRTLDTTAGETDTIFYKVTEVDNADGSYDDNANDNDLTTLAENNNTAPPKAKFICLHKDRMIYANCPDENYGKSLFMFSKVGSPEAVPSSNYQYFDRDDGGEITGIASLPDYLLIFKKNKIAVMEGDFEQWYTISNGIGSISGYALIELPDRVIFIAEEGIKATDGRTVYDIGKTLRPLVVSKYFTLSNGLEYTAMYYPEKKQIQLMLYSATLTRYVIVGHLLDALYRESNPEYSTGEMTIAWTYHNYSNHTFRTLGKYTDTDGMTRLIAGSHTGYVYLLDHGTDDDTYDIEMEVQLGWSNFGMPTALTKILRIINISYEAPDTTEARVYYDTDFTLGSSYVALLGVPDAYCYYAYCDYAYCGLESGISENLDVDDGACGKAFWFRGYDNSSSEFTLLSIEGMFRPEGIR